MLLEHSELGCEKIEEIIDREGAKVYFIGIGGVGMSALAEALLADGASVYGSDREKSERTERLRSFGAEIYPSQSGENIEGSMPDLVVYTLAVDSQNGEYRTAMDMKIPTVSRAQLLGAVIKRKKYSIGISGSHGKSTVCAMLYGIFEAAKVPSELIIGAPLSDGRTYIKGEDTIIYEACEYRDSFLKMTPSLSVFLNLELDHTDYFPDISALKASFIKAAELAGTVLLCTDDVNLNSIMPMIKKTVYTFGYADTADYRITDVTENDGKYGFCLSLGKEPLGRFQLSIPGKFNVTNAAAAIAAAHIRGINPLCAQRALEKFSGIPRRLERIGEYGGAAVFYDYAHHPSEMKAGIGAIRDMGYRRVGLIFCPHTYSRTSALWREFIDAICSSDVSVITDIYAAREEPISGVDSKRLARAAVQSGAECAYRRGGEAVRFISERNPDAIVLMGAGDLDGIKRILTKKC